MRILLVGQAAFAEEVLRGLEAAGDTIAAVVCPPDAGPKPDPVKAAALARGIPVHQFRSLKAPEARHAFAEARADLGVLAYVTQIVPEPLLHIPRLTSICFHPSLLPRYRGGSAIAWQLIRGETESGVTVFWPDAGIDTGPILLQRSAPGAPARAAPGTVLAIDGDGLTVAARDGAIRCARARNGGAKTPAAEVARPLGLEPGARLA